MNPRSAKKGRSAQCWPLSRILLERSSSRLQIPQIPSKIKQKKWNVGMMEYWKMGFKIISLFLPFQYSTIPLFRSFEKSLDFPSNLFLIKINFHREVPWPLMPQP
jgi:hypothetical protein